MKMIVLLVGNLAAIPPWGFLLKPLGETEQLCGLAVQCVGLALIVWGWTHE